ncbi:cilia- and flagella-associated protein 46 [Genypterus blacodes]|uniref:cilia- and flagella-associated protein 46 n=1 Tax=Genypterus blacodes TaxID=154954 RepID=UPI003F758E45
MDLEIRHYLAKATEEHDAGALQAAFSLIKEQTAAGSPRFAPELYVLCAEEALQLGFFEISTVCLNMYFEGKPLVNQFLCRAYLCQGRVKSLSGTASVGDIENAILYLMKAIEVSKKTQRYHFIVFNASVLYLQTVRPLLQPGKRFRLVPSLSQVVQSLEEVSEQDHCWRAELMMHLVECIVDSGKMEDACSFARVTEEFIKSNTPHLYPKLFTFLMRHKLLENDVDELTRDSNASAVIYKIQELKKVAFLLELALLALQVKHQEVAAKCLKELKSAGEATIGERIIMECVNCELNLLKKQAKINEYSKADVEAQLKEIGNLDQLLQTAVREGDPQAMQAACATQWNFCLPLLQHNLKRRVKTAILRVSQVLEDIQSMFLEMRCQVHSELAAIEEEEGRLEASMTHLEKAVLLDKGTQQERLASAIHRLQLRGMLDQTPSRVEDKAAMLMQQAKDVQPQDMTDSRSTLIAVGLLLAPEAFQMVLDAEDTSTFPVGSLGSDPATQLSVKAEHHAEFVMKVDGHLARKGGGGSRIERVNLWASLVKTARKHNVWDVCRAACRFCLLYDDGKWKTSPTNKRPSSKKENQKELRHDTSKDVLWILAEICFINAEATIEMLQTEGVQLNSPAVPPEESGICVADPHWVVYRDWIKALSAYATSNFLRAAELGAKIEEPWLVVNTAIYLWNYNNHWLAAGAHRRLLPTFQKVVERLQRTEYTGDRTLVVLLCTAVARGFIRPLHRADSSKAGGSGKSTAGKGTEKTNRVPLQDLHKALELCNYALRLSNCNLPEESVPIVARKQVLDTWVQIKRTMQEQIVTKMDTGDECVNGEVLAMTYVLLGVEMFQCNRIPGQMQFTLPSLSTLVEKASECSWTDALVELQVWSQLATFCHDANNHNLVLLCTKRALQLENPAAKSLKSMLHVLYPPSAVNEMLSSAACARGLSLAHESCGDLQSYREALKVLLSSVSYAEKAENLKLCLTFAGHYWNTCLPLTQTPGRRCQLQEPLDKILCVLHTCTKQGKVKGCLALTTLPVGSFKPKASNDDLTLRAAIYSLLLYIHADRGDWKSYLQLLDKAVTDMPSNTHRLFLVKQRILLKARRGESVLKDMQWFRQEGELCSSLMWHQVALCDGNINHQLSAYQNSITTLLSAESQQQKANILLVFGKWLYSHNFPATDAQHQIEYAIDVLLQVNSEETKSGKGMNERSNTSSVISESMVGVQGVSFIQSLSDLTEMRCLDTLVKAYTLLAVMTDRTSPQRQLNLLLAYIFVLQIWRVSMAKACEINNLTMKKPESAAPKEVKGKKAKKPPTPEEIPKSQIPDPAPPTTLQDWAHYCCAERTRQIFSTNTSPHCINKTNITKQSLFYLDLLVKELHSLSLDHLTLPIMHLAEAIAHDVLDSRSLSDLYQLRIVKKCWELGMDTHSPYCMKVQELSGINELEQIEYNVEVDDKVVSGQQSTDVSIQDIWLDKAEVCLSMGFYQPARQLLAEAHLVAMELEDHRTQAKALLGLAILACEEQSYAEALTLLNKAQTLGGDEEFCYQLTLIMVRAIAGQKDEDEQTKISEIVKKGCGVLQLVQEQQTNLITNVTYLITSLQMRGALACIQAIGDFESGQNICTEAVQRLKEACDTVGDCALRFTRLNYVDHAAEAHVENAHGLRILANHTPNIEDKRRHMLDAFSQMQVALTLQERVVQKVQSLLSQQEESRGLGPMRRLQSLRLSLSEFCLGLLEQRCTEEKHRALARCRMTAVEIAIEDFTRCLPSLNSTEQEWVNVCRTLGQVFLGQLAAINLHSMDNVETRAHCFALKGKFLRLQALQKDPVYVSALWDRHKKDEAWSDSKTSPVEEEDLKSEEDAEFLALQQRRHEVQQLLDNASKTLSEAITLCLQHNLPSSILADASFNMMECYGQSEPGVSGQYLALFQSCCSVAMMAKILSSACADSSASQLSALLSLRRKLFRSPMEWPSNMLKGVEDSLNGLSQVFSHLTINPGHLNILAELPPNLRILLLQHTEDGSELYGAFYECTEGLKGKGADPPTCSRVAMVSVCPQALLAVREQTRVFGQETRHALLKEARWYSCRDKLQAPQEHQVLPFKTLAEEKLSSDFRDIVQNMENYLCPLLTQFDFSCFRRQVESLPETPKPKGKEKATSAKVSPPKEPWEYLVLLADRKLLDLPLEALSVLQQAGLCSVSRDFSLQLLRSRLNPFLGVESDKKKKSKGGKATKGKADQSEAIKVREILPPNTFPVDTCNFKFIVDSYNEGNFEGTSLTEKMKNILETHRRPYTNLWEGFMGSLPETEQLLSGCSAFIYQGMERFMANVPPAKLAVLDLSGCRMALIFDLVQNNASAVRQSTLDMQKRLEHLALEKPLETAVLLSVTGVNSVVLNQWHSKAQRNTSNMAAFMDNLLGVGLSSGQTVHILRKEGRHSTEILDCDEVSLTSEEDDVHHKATIRSSTFNLILYGLPNLMVV